MNVIKHTKTQRRMLQELLVKRGGCVMQSEWTNGSGSYTTRRAVPVYSEDLSLDAACKLGGAAGKAARRVRKAHPRCERVIIVTDIRRARACIGAVEGAAELARAGIRHLADQALTSSDQAELLAEIKDQQTDDRDGARILMDRLYQMGRQLLAQNPHAVDLKLMAHLDEVREWGQK